MKTMNIAIVAVILALASPLKAAEAEAKTDTKARSALEKKLRDEIINRLEFEETPLGEVIDYLSNANGRKFNIVAVGFDAEDAPVVSMSIVDLPLYTVLSFVCDLTGSKLHIDNNVVVIVCGKGAPPNAYDVKLKVTPAKGLDNRFKVEFQISEKQADGKETLLSGPSLTVEAGHKGVIKVGSEGEKGEKGESGVTCTATVTPTDDALKVDTSVSIKRDGKILWSCTQETTVTK